MAVYQRAPYKQSHMHSPLGQFRVVNTPNIIYNISPETWPHTKIPSVAAKPNAKFTVRNIP